MHKRILINVEPQEKRVALLEGESLEEFYVERPGQERLVGNVYKGKVTAILPGMGAAFVELGLAKNGFLHVSDVVERPPDLEELLSEEIEEEQPVGTGLSEKSFRDEETCPHTKEMPRIENLLHKGQEILVQIVKEPIGTKGPRLTTHISLPGRFLVLMPYENRIGVSKRIIKQSERARIKSELTSLKIPKDVGLIVRTAASGCKRRTFASEVNFLLNLWENIKKEEKAASAPKLLHQEYDLILRVVRDIFTSEVSRLIVDDKEEYKKIAHFVGSIMPFLRLRIRYYRGETPLFENFGIEKEIAKIYENRIYLKNKGYVVIEQTEGLVAIDVNTGGFVGQKDLEETAYLTNTEAAKEVARQIRLRDMGGIIVIDFIDMEERRHRQELFETLKKALKRDKARTKVLNISPLGLVEMTRQRMRKSVESISYKICPYCNGRGSVKSVVTVSIEAKRKLIQAMKVQGRSKEEIVLYVHPDVCRHLLTQDKGSISFLENKYRRRIIIRENPAFHIEEIEVGTIKV